MTEEVDLSKIIPRVNPHPAPPPTPLVEALGAEAVERWGVLWRQGVALLWTEADGSLVERLVEAEHSYAVLASKLAEGAPSNVLTAEIAKARNAVSRLEARLMMSRDQLRRQGYREAERPVVESAGPVSVTESEVGHLGSDCRNYMWVDRPESAADDDHPAGAQLVLVPGGAGGSANPTERARCLAHARIAARAGDLERAHGMGERWGGWTDDESHAIAADGDIGSGEAS